MNASVELLVDRKHWGLAPHISILWKGNNQSSITKKRRTTLEGKVSVAGSRGREGPNKSLRRGKVLSHFQELGRVRKRRVGRSNVPVDHLIVYQEEHHLVKEGTWDYGKKRVITKKENSPGDRTHVWFQHLEEGRSTSLKIRTGNLSFKFLRIS